MPIDPLAHEWPYDDVDPIVDVPDPANDEPIVDDGPNWEDGWE